MRRIRILEGKRVGLILFMGSLLLLTSCSLFKSETELRPQITSTTPAVVSKPELPYCKIDYDYPLSNINHAKIYVYKGERRLLVVQDGILVRDYLVGLGPQPSGDKFYMGDGKTPEGDFFICVKNPASKFYKSLGLNYPSVRHADQALSTGKISLEEYRSILQANEIKCLPPPNTTLGGAIFIHGGGGHKDWTQGCIAVSDSAMDELFQIVSVGTPVEVLP